MASDIKPGWQTSEGIATFVVTIGTFLVQIGVIHTQDASMVESSVTKIATGIMAAVALFKYIESRAKVKTANGNGNSVDAPTTGSLIQKLK